MEQWVPHPQDPAWEYNLANPSQMRPAQTAAAPPAAPAQNVPQAIPQGTMQTGELPTEYASMSDELPKAWDGSGFGPDYPSIDWPDIGSAVGARVELSLRLVPGAVGQDLVVAAAMHMLESEHFGGAAGGKVPIYCYESHGGPGNCEVCKTYREMTAAGHDVSDMKGSPRLYTLALDMGPDTAKHWEQLTDDSGKPVLDANGQPVWKVVPHVFRLGKRLYDQWQAIKRRVGDLADPRGGYVLTCEKHRKGRGRFDIEYFAHEGQRYPLLGSQYESALLNTFDLRERVVVYRDRDEVSEALAKMRAALGGAGVQVPGQVGGWQPHPQNPAYQWNPQTGQVMPAPAAAPAPAPVAPVLPPAAPAVAAPPAPPAAPPGPPMPPAAALPPAMAPGLPGAVPAAPPAPAAAPPPPAAAPPPPAAAPPPPAAAAPPPPAMQAVPPAPPAAPVGGPPPGPGMPQGAVPDTSPAGAASGPNGAMSAAELEAQVGKG